jgi:hypothetical protein
MMLRRLWGFMDLYGYGGWISPFPPAHPKKPLYINGFFILKIHSDTMSWCLRG